LIYFIICIYEFFNLYLIFLWKKCVKKMHVFFFNFFFFNFFFLTRWNRCQIASNVKSDSFTPYRSEFLPQHHLVSSLLWPDTSATPCPSQKTACVRCCLAPPPHPLFLINVFFFFSKSFLSIPILKTNFLIIPEPLVPGKEVSF